MNKDSHIAHLKSILKDVDLTTVLEQIEKFRALDLKNITDLELQNQVYKAVSIKSSKGLQEAMLFPRIAIYPKTTRFYRIRPLDASDTKIPLKAMTYEADAWNPPPEKVKIKRGRLNLEGESLLYTTPVNPSTCIEEMKIKEEELFCLIVYEAVEDVKVCMIGEWGDIAELTREENLIIRLINNFLRDEFTRDVGAGTEFLYRVSELITKHFFDLPPRVVQDAWCYPSVAQKPSHNVCFRPDIAKEKLKLIGVQINKYVKVNDGYQIACKAIASGFDHNGVFKYYPIGSEVQKTIFPEFDKR